MKMVHGVGKVSPNIYKSTIACGNSVLLAPKVQTSQAKSSQVKSTHSHRSGRRSDCGTDNRRSLQSVVDDRSDGLIDQSRTSDGWAVQCACVVHAHSPTDHRDHFVRSSGTRSSHHPSIPRCVCVCVCVCSQSTSCFDQMLHHTHSHEQNSCSNRQHHAHFHIQHTITLRKHTSNYQHSTIDRRTSVGRGVLFIGV